MGDAGVAKLADAPDLGSGAARRGGSSPFTRTNKKGSEKSEPFFYVLAGSVIATGGLSPDALGKLRENIKEVLLAKPRRLRTLAASVIASNSLSACQSE